ncbi:tim-barrel domain-containing protein [Gamsiella multidivaricata]|uniref:tim-barrel domain-containing protein n=1 Tax=Gamsiella multidivaricata TaxID=101098 RepID=UPI00221F1E10|nr:tim-barrel domain-containing protein [Gamsiella multidivaricata]KAI7832691.1 tim-barrel domain-containing protein [Gamsiella multidivaricata]
MAAPAPVNSTASLQGLVQRLLPRSYHNAFDFKLVSDLAPPTPENKYDVFRVSNKNSTNAARIMIEGTTLSALSRGLKYYLDQAGQVELTWSGNRFDELPQTPPPVPDLEIDTKKVATAGHVRGSIVPWRYYTNVVSYGYQFAFWDWKRWEREIDWMALNGINMLPAMIGQEYVVREFYRSLGLTDEDIDSFIAGPAYMPWQRMGNLQGSWNHDLLNSSAANELVYKKKWIDAQWDLQQLILARLQALDITAVLPTFQAFVPRALVNKFPNNEFKNTSVWSFFPEKYTMVTYVEQTDPLFNELSTKFLQLQQKMNNGYQAHYYLLDLYNELVPDCVTPECLKATTTSVTKALQAADKDAVWVMQGWFLTNTAIWTPEATAAYFQGIRDANGTPFIYDLASESMPIWNSNDGFYGNNFGWSLLNNFGAAQGLFAKLPELLTVPFEAYEQYSGNLKGMGVTAEGINNNEYIYQTMLELPWHSPKETINGTQHLQQFIRRRYGATKATALVQDAWNKLRQTVWDCQSGQASQSKSFVEKLPALNMTNTDWLGTVFWYNQTIVVQAWDQLVRAALHEQHANVPKSFKFDLVDTTREVLLATVFPALHESLIDGYETKNLQKIRNYGRQIIALIRDADTLLNTSPFFSLGSFIREAKASIDPTGGPSKAGYEQFLESNARNIVTWWGPEGTGPPGSLPDYASKQWGGLLNSFYLPRWELFIQQLEQAVATKTAWDPEDYLKKNLAREAQWQAEVWGRRPGETVLNGQESTEVVRELWDKYRALAVKIAAGGKA